MSDSKQYNRIKNWLFLFISLLMLTSFYQQTMAQEKPPRPISLKVKTSGVLQFGAFTQGALGGTVTISPEGARTRTGDVILLSLGYSYSPLIMQVQAIKGTVVHIETGHTGTLTGGTPSGSMNLQVGGTYPHSPFVVTSDASEWMDIWVGGTLLVGTPGANPPGSYSGPFDVTFIQE